MAVVDFTGHARPHLFSPVEIARAAPRGAAFAASDQKAIDALSVALIRMAEVACVEVHHAA